MAHAFSKIKRDREKVRRQRWSLVPPAPAPVLAREGSTRAPGWAREGEGRARPTGERGQHCPEPLRSLLWMGVPRGGDQGLAAGWVGIVLTVTHLPAGMGNGGTRRA